MSDALYPKSLSDLEPLSPAEQIVLKAFVAGQTAELGESVPERADDQTTVRAGLVRLLANGGCDGVEVHPKGVSIQGGWITTHLDLDGCSVRGRFALKHCKLEQVFHARDTNFNSITLGGSHIAGFDAAGLNVSGDIHLNAGLRSKGAIDLTHADIGGQLDCSGGVFMNPEGSAFLAQWIKVRGSVYLKDGFSTVGEVSFDGADIGGQLALVRAFLEDDHSHAFSAQNLRVKEIFYFRDNSVKEGTILLTGAHVGALADDAKSWPVGRVMMDGFTYERFVYSDTKLQTRLAWLDTHSSNAFQPQPYQQLAKVLGEMGHRLDQSRVLMAMERKLRANQRATLPKIRASFHGFWDWVLREFTGYGYRPWRVARLATPVILLVALFGALIWERGDFAPAATPALMSAGWQQLATGDDVQNPAKIWSAKEGPGRDYETFNPVLYAVDLVVPLVNLGQEDAWAPSTSRGIAGKIAHWVLPVVEVLGWVITALGAAAVTGVIRRE